MIEKCTGIKGEEVCPFRDNCLRYKSEPEESQIWLSKAPFEHECEFFFDVRRPHLEKREGHLRFDNNFEYVYENKHFVKYRINYELNKSTGQPL